MASNRFNRDDIWTPSQLGLNTVSINAAVSSNAFGVEGANQLTISATYTVGAGTGVSFTLQQRHSATATWHDVESGEIAAGVETLTDLTPTITTGSTVHKVLHFSIHGVGDMRLTNILAAGAPNSTDTFAAVIYVSHVV